MNIITHMIISGKLLSQLEGCSPIKLKKLHYLYGSIKPDISRKMSNIPHYKPLSQEYVKSEIRKLSTQDCNTNEYSVRIGLITHFLSDYFVSPIRPSSTAAFYHIIFMKAGSWYIF